MTRVAKILEGLMIRRPWVRVPPAPPEQVLACGNVCFWVPERQLCLNGLDPPLVGLESGGARGIPSPSDLRRSRRASLSLAVGATVLRADATAQGPYRGRDDAVASSPAVSAGRLVVPRLHGMGCHSWHGASSRYRAGNEGGAEADVW